MKKVVKRKNKKLTPSKKIKKVSKVFAPQKNLKNNIKKNSKKDSLISTIKENKLLQIAIIISVLLVLAILVATLGNTTGNSITGFDSEQGGTVLDSDSEEGIEESAAVPSEKEPSRFAQLFGVKDIDNPPINTSDIKWNQIVGAESAATVMTYIFGDPIKAVNLEAIRAGIITICMWLIIFFTFGSTFSQLSSFPKLISWILGFLVTAIIANFNVINLFMLGCVKVLGVIGITSVLISLVMAFVALIAINLGVNAFSSWALRRQTAINSIKIKSGAANVGSAIQGLGEVASSFKKADKKAKK